MAVMKNGMLPENQESRQKIEYILSNHQPLPLSEEMEQELENIFNRAKET